MHNLKLKHNPLFLFLFKRTPRLTWPPHLQGSFACFRLSNQTPLKPILDFSPSGYQISLWQVKSCNPTSNGGFIWLIYGLVVNWADAEWERFPFAAYDEITERHQSLGFYSQAILPSKPERAMAKACTAHRGYL